MFDRMLKSSSKTDEKKRTQQLQQIKQIKQIPSISTTMTISTIPLKTNCVTNTLKQVLDENVVTEFKYENPPQKFYVPRFFLSGRGSWRAAQGNIYTQAMLLKDIEDEFNQRLN